MDEDIRRLFDKLKTAHDHFLQVAGQLPAEKRYQPGVCGEWSPKEVVAHLVGWDQLLKTFILAPEKFEPPDDVNTFNAQSVSSKDQLNWKAVMEEMESNFQELGQALASVTPEMKMYQRVNRWLPGRIEDYEQHSGQLAAWLG